jgi:hypothetical protein
MNFVWITICFWKRINSLGTESGGQISDLKQPFREIENDRLSVDHRGPIAGLYRDSGVFFD